MCESNKARPMTDTFKMPIIKRMVRLCDHLGYEFPKHVSAEIVSAVQWIIGMQSTLQLLQKAHPDSLPEIRVIHNAICTDFFTLSYKETVDLRVPVLGTRSLKVHIPESGPVIATCEHASWAAEHTSKMLGLMEAVNPGLCDHGMAKAAEEISRNTNTVQFERDTGLYYQRLLQEKIDSKHVSYQEIAIKMGWEK